MLYPAELYAVDSQEGQTDTQLSRRQAFVENTALTLKSFVLKNSEGPRFIVIHVKRSFKTFLPERDC